MIHFRRAGSKNNQATLFNNPARLTSQDHSTILNPESIKAITDSRIENLAIVRTMFTLDCADERRNQNISGSKKTKKGDRNRHEDLPHQIPFREHRKTDRATTPLNQGLSTAQYHG
jgi:hypothetical protein